MVGRQHEQDVCNAVLRLMSHRKKGTVVLQERPEEIERKRKAVELQFKIEGTEYVLEHTRIESFPEQILDDRQWWELLEPLEKTLNGQMPTPGHYWLGAAVRAVKGARNPEVIRSRLLSWIKEQASRLEIGSPGTSPRHLVRASLEGVPFEVTLYRWPGLDGRFMLVRSSPKDLEELRKKRIRAAFDAKCPKLSEAKGRDRVSVLVLESNDLALANSAVIGEAAAEELSLRNEEVPDEVYLVETELEQQWVVWVLKEGALQFPHVPGDGPHYIEPKPLDEIRMQPK